MDPECKLINLKLDLDLSVEDGEQLLVSSPNLQSNTVTVADVEAFIRQTAEEQIRKVKQFFHHRQTRMLKFNDDGTRKKAEETAEG